MATWLRAALRHAGLVLVLLEEQHHDVVPLMVSQPQQPAGVLLVVGPAVLLLRPHAVHHDDDFAFGQFARTSRMVCSIIAVSGCDLIGLVGISTVTRSARAGGCLPRTSGTPRSARSFSSQ